MEQNEEFRVRIDLIQDFNTIYMCSCVVCILQLYNVEADVISVSK